MTASKPTLYFEDVVVGTTLESPGYRVEREEIIEFATRWDPFPFHLDEAAARDSIFGGLAACAPHSFAILSRLSHALPRSMALVAGLGGDGLQLLAPVRAGIEVRLVRRFTAKRGSRSRPEVGVVSFEDALVTPEGEAVFRTSGSVLLARRPTG